MSATTELIFLTLFVVFIVFVIMAMVIMIGIVTELLIQNLYGEDITTFQECRLLQGQTMVDELCEKKSKCLNKGLFLRTCDQIKEVKGK